MVINMQTKQDGIALVTSLVFLVVATVVALSGMRNSGNEMQMSSNAQDLNYAFQTDTKLHLVMSYISGGELFTRLCASGHFSLDTTRFYVAELVLALDKLHQVPVLPAHSPVTSAH